MSALPKFDRTLKRREAKQKKFRQRYLELRFLNRMDSGEAVRQIANEFNLTSDRCFVIIRPADVRVMLERDWFGTMRKHGLDIPYPDEVRSLDELEAVV